MLTDNNMTQTIIALSASIGYSLWMILIVNIYMKHRKQTWIVPICFMIPPFLFLCYVLYFNILIPINYV